MKSCMTRIVILLVFIVVCVAKRHPGRGQTPQSEDGLQHPEHIQQGQSKDGSSFLKIYDRIKQFLKNRQLRQKSDSVNALLTAKKMARHLMAIWPYGGFQNFQSFGGANETDPLEFVQVCQNQGQETTRRIQNRVKFASERLKATVEGLESRSYDRIIGDLKVDQEFMYETLGTAFSGATISVLSESRPKGPAFECILDVNKMYGLWTIMFRRLVTLTNLALGQLEQSGQSVVITSAGKKLLKLSYSYQYYNRKGIIKTCKETNPVTILEEVLQEFKSAKTPEKESLQFAWITAAAGIVELAIDLNAICYVLENFDEIAETKAKKLTNMLPKARQDVQQLQQVVKQWRPEERLD